MGQTFLSTPHHSAWGGAKSEEYSANSKFYASKPLVLSEKSVLIRIDTEAVPGKGKFFLHPCTIRKPLGRMGVVKMVLSVMQS